jgi:outer membrane protein
MAESLFLHGRPILKKFHLKGAIMRKQFYSAAALLSLMMGSAFAENSPGIGIVDFSNCITESKAGKKEQENMENLRKQMSTLVENTEKELREITAKFDDVEYLDSLSPKAEEDLKMKHQALQEDLGRYQQQIYQVLNHANYQMVHKMISTISTAAEKIAQEKGLDYVMNRESCFYVRPDLDVTSLVVAEMDKTFETADKTQKLSDNDGEFDAPLADQEG